MQIIIIGASGHGKVISDIISYNIEKVGGEVAISFWMVTSKEVQKYMVIL